MLTKCTMRIKSLGLHVFWHKWHTNRNFRPFSISPPSWWEKCLNLMPFLNIFWLDIIHLKFWILNNILPNFCSGELTESHWCHSQKSIFLTFGHKDFLWLDCPYFCLCGCHYSPFLLSHNCQSIKLVPEQLLNAMQHQHSCFNQNRQFHEKSTCGEISIFVPKTVFVGTS